MARFFDSSFDFTRQDAENEWAVCIGVLGRWVRRA